MIWGFIKCWAWTSGVKKEYECRIKQIHRPGGAMYRPIQGHEWQWHHEWRRVSSKSHEWCHWHEWPCIGWYIPHPGRCISNPLENRTNRDVLHTIRDVLYKYATPKALRSRKYGSQVPNLASRVATSQLKEPRVMPDLARVTRIFNCANNFWVGYLHCYIEDGRQFHEISYSQTKTFVHFHSKYLTKIIKKKSTDQITSKD